MTNTDKLMCFALWVCALGFIAYQLLQEANMSKQCIKTGGVVVISSRLSAVCVRRALEALDD